MCLIFAVIFQFLQWINIKIKYCKNTRFFSKNFDHCNQTLFVNDVYLLPRENHKISSFRVRVLFHLIALFWSLRLNGDLKKKVLRHAISLSNITIDFRAKQWEKSLSRGDRFGISWCRHNRGSRSRVVIVILLYFSNLYLYKKRELKFLNYLLIGIFVHIEVTTKIQVEIEKYRFWGIHLYNSYVCNLLKK